MKARPSKKDTDKKLEYLKALRKKIILWEADNKIQEAQLCVLKGGLTLLLNAWNYSLCYLNFILRISWRKKGKESTTTCLI